ncbi:hypothetical protein DKAM_1428 [Desulfurococcus amylolyticus 1221n]|uniref:Uncharacterized protein n=1 Tax=Desulfurococcus amylolyticus (strain DSM 18924 / JCM 16383 / VKM B-2413 / 1221n) TaxID=490899 RepID=B8D6M3_DESA1|nr:hypothetical protein DKAM_1428 [Desulfurococcus amylolyticus 1221n]
MSRVLLWISKPITSISDVNGLRGETNYYVVGYISGAI